MKGKTSGSHSKRELKRSLNRRILRSTIFNILALVVICCIIMAVSMQSLANDILLDSLQPMARQSSKTVEANIHMLADRMMTIAGDTRMMQTVGFSAEGQPPQYDWRSRQTVLEEAAEIYELHTIALYDLNGGLIQGISGAPEQLEGSFLSLMKETDNLTTHSSTIFQGKLGITMGMPVKENGETALYVVGVYKYDALDDVLGSINVGKSGTAYMVGRDGSVTGHPDRSFVLNGGTLSQLSGGNESSLSRALTGETGAVEFSMNGSTMMAFFSPIRGTHWVLVIQMPKSDYNYLINRAMMTAILTTLAGLVLSILLVLRLSRSISRPVKAVTNRMVALSDGDLHTEIPPTHSGDELEVLTGTLGSTVESLNHYISDIQQVLTQVANGNLDVQPQVEYTGDFTLIRGSLITIIQSLNGTISGFRSAAARLADMADELNGQSGQLHQASLEQNHSTDELVQHVATVKERLANVTQSSIQTRAQTGEIAQRIQEANAQMASLSSAMDDISANAKQITAIAKAIEDIAFQTGILSINASVEAARAGEAGKGFSVVANEVKELAARSAEAAQNATNVVNNTRSIIQTGVELTAHTAGSIQSISQVSTQIDSISDRLVSAVQAQETALGEMEEQIEVITAIAGRNLQNASGTEQSSGLLAREAEGLQAEVRKFILREEARK